MFRLLPGYTEYMARHPDSLICKFVGFHSIKLYNLTLYFVVMLSVFLTPLAIHEKYDLKVMCGCVQSN
jgi:1-phosphatidylinositol-4-phosphate 5-kinase